MPTSGDFERIRHFVRCDLSTTILQRREPIATLRMREAVTIFMICLPTVRVTDRPIHQRGTWAEVL